MFRLRILVIAGNSADVWSVLGCRSDNGRSYGLSGRMTACTLQSSRPRRPCSQLRSVLSGSKLPCLLISRALCCGCVSALLCRNQPIVLFLSRLLLALLRCLHALFMHGGQSISQRSRCRRRCRGSAWGRLLSDVGRGRIGLQSRCQSSPHCRGKSRPIGRRVRICPGRSGWRGRALTMEPGRNLVPKYQDKQGHYSKNQ